MLPPTPEGAAPRDLPTPGRASPPSPAHTAELRRTWALVAPIGDEAAQLYFDRLLELDPSLRPCLRGAAGELPHRELLALLERLAHDGDAHAALQQLLRSPGSRLARCGPTAAQHRRIADALLWTLDEGLGVLGTASACAAWTAACELLLAALRTDSSETPPHR